MKVALVGSHGFARGPYHPDNITYCRDLLIEKIDLAERVGSRSVITFTGMIAEGVSPEQGARNWNGLLMSFNGTGGAILAAGTSLAESS